MKRIIDGPSDVDFMQLQDRWPMWPRLPLKRYHDHGLELGTIYGTLEGPLVPRVYLANIYEAIDDQTPSIIYDRFEAIAADGWRVD